MFALRNQAFEAAKEQRQAITAQAEQLIERLNQFAAQTLAQLNSAKADVEAIKAEFATLDLPKEAKGLYNKFNASISAIATKRDSARSQAEEQSWTDLFTVLNALREYEVAVVAQTASESLAVQKTNLETLIANTPRWPTGCFSQVQQRLAKVDAITSAIQTSNTELLHTLTIRAEILAGQDSPAEDKQARMAYQVKQMQQAFGLRDSSFEPLVLEWIALGGVATPAYTTLLSRFNGARAHGVKS